MRVTLYLDPVNSWGDEAGILACLEDADVLAQLRARSGKDQQALLRAVLAQPDAASQEKKILATIALLSNCRP